MSKFASNRYYCHSCISLDIFLAQSAIKFSLLPLYFLLNPCILFVIDRNIDTLFWCPRIHLQAKVSCCWRSLHTVIYFSIGCIFFFFTLTHTSRSSTHLLIISVIFWLRTFVFNMENNGRCFLFFFISDKQGTLEL